MAKLIALSILCFFCTTGIVLAQTAKKIESDHFQARTNGKAKTLFDKHLYSGESNTINFSVQEYSMETLKTFNEELKTFHEKIEQLSLNKKTMVFTITYNWQMQRSDLVSIFDKHGINYMVDDVTNTNVQNQ